MGILEIQKQLRWPELGRIRMGAKLVSAKGKPYPAKLDTWRLTSRYQHLLDAAAEAFGGTVESWDGQWSLITETDTLPVRVPPQDFDSTQWLEQWTSSGLERRCDGEQMTIPEPGPCACDPNQRDCSPVTQLSLMLPDLPELGTWRLVTRGWHAANELRLAIIQIAQAFRATGELVSAQLRLEQRTKPARHGEPPLRYAVPVIVGLPYTLNQLLETSSRSLPQGVEPHSEVDSAESATGDDDTEPTGPPSVPAPPVPVDFTPQIELGDLGRIVAGPAKNRDSTESWIVEVAAVLEGAGLWRRGTLRKALDARNVQAVGDLSDDDLVAMGDSMWAAARTAVQGEVEGRGLGGEE